MNLHQMREKVLPKLLHNSQTFKSNCTIPDSLHHPACVAQSRYQTVLVNGTAAKISIETNVL